MENRNRKKLRVLLAVVVLAAFGIGAAVYLALWKNGAVTGEKSDPAALINRLRILQTTGGKLELSGEEINGVLKTLLNKPVEKGGAVISGAYADIKNGSITVYAPVKYKNMNLLPNIKGKIRFENEKVIFDIASVRVGKLSIPKSILLEQLRGFSNGDINVAGNSIEISKFLLPFNAKNIYLEDDKLVAEVDKLNILKEISAEKSDSNKNTNAGQSSKNSSNTNSSNTAQNNSSQVQSGSGTGRNTEQTPVSESAKAAQADTLKKVSSQLNGVISSVSTTKEKQMIKKIQTVVNEVTKDPGYPYQKDANEVKVWYSTLQPEAKASVKDAILKNVSPMEILKLINIFGV